jgi:enterochelin esterase-like enzyme
VRYQLRHTPNGTSIMRGMSSRQAKLIFAAAAFALLLGLSACMPSDPVPSTPTAILIPTSTATPLPTLPPPTATPLGCLTAPGELRSGEVPTNGQPTLFIIYLPPCYDAFPDQHYPVLYLLNGQTYTADQWVRLGAPTAADTLIHSGQAEPFIIVFPDDRYWNLPQGEYFGQYLVNDIMPFIDSNFRTIPDRGHRAIGGLSRGGGWALQLGLRLDLFASVGLHSPAAFPEDRTNIVYWIQKHDPDTWPRLYIDSGDNDRERGFNSQFESLLTEYGIPHEWRLNPGAHDEIYWGAHVFEYMVWYTEGFALAQQAESTPTASP